jgi:hypothetical protein
MQISAKDLGWLAEDGFCPRCFWIVRHHKVPYQTGFPGIFSSIDSYTKHIVEHHFERTGRLPGWLSGIGAAKRIIEIRASEFRTARGSVTLTGIPDLLFQRPDGSYCIADYKTARYTGNQDSLMPVYRIQLNGYAYIAEHLDFRPVRDLYLVYFEPPHSATHAEITGKHTTSEGFEMPFRPRIHKLKKDTQEVERLIAEAGRIYSMGSPPEGIGGCEDCERLDDLVSLVGEQKE